MPQRKYKLSAKKRATKRKAQAKYYNRLREHGLMKYIKYYKCGIKI